MEELRDIGEHEILRRLCARLGRHPDLVVGPGDDCAVVRTAGSGFDQVLTTDPLVEGVHFDPGEDPFRIGNKAAGRVLSDIAAMGASPQWLLVNVVAPPALPFNVLEQVYEGMTALCRRFAATIIGGDLARGPHLEIHVFGTGVLPAGTALLRSGAGIGDSIFVTGPLGGSRQGHHLDFVPRVEEGLFLRESGMAGAMMDISDGLATDLRHIMQQSGVGAELDAERIPRTGTLGQALYDGEDFELLFTVRPEHMDGLLQAWDSRFDARPVCIGRTTHETGLLNLRLPEGGLQELTAKAFEHFSS
jgi:thiamine-monophosphate kinase